jgi:hypothetical protein
MPLASQWQNFTKSLPNPMGGASSSGSPLPGKNCSHNLQPTSHAWAHRTPPIPTFNEFRLLCGWTAATTGKDGHCRHGGSWAASCRTSLDVAAVSASTSLTFAFAMIMMAAASDDAQAGDEDKCLHNLPTLEIPITDLQRRLAEGLPEKKEA